ncbi:arginase [Dechloromonas denitrificans]|uniref:arginase n=1 Tax=Dechloromonas denitrificans TaxID=281362 RepID=UPI001CFA8962|nr:arginase [Dechloromonas denitrificans]UCV09856.1 arginase [Dechloromonas denitrificans]
MASKIRIIGAASGLGAQDQGCEDGPVAFHRSQAWHELEHHPRVDWGKTLFASNAPGLSELGRIAGLCRNLAEEVAVALRADEFPLVIGGDHSVAIGTWSGVARFVGAPSGLLWIDAHLDSHTPETSYSGAVHGMPLACLLGRGDKRLLNIGRVGEQVSAAHTVVFGPRSYEPEEMDFLRQMGVRIIDSEEVLARGFAACLDEAIGIVAKAPAGFGVTLDLDAIDPVLAPGVGSPEPEGLWDGDVLVAMRRLSAMPGLRAVEIVEYNPDRDWQGTTARLIADLIGQILPGVTGRDQPQG